MHLDVVRLRDFYATRLGAATAREISGRIQDIWPDMAGLAILGLGYAAPYLGPFLATQPGRSTGRVPERVIAINPAAQGVHPWIPHGARANLSALAHETSLPLPDESMDRVLMVHVLETAEETRALLREIWRILRPGGRILAVVPNRSGPWAISDRTPFGHGQPFSRGQLDALFADHMFTPQSRSVALFTPPGAGIRLLSASERIGRRLWPRFGGVLLMEAEKRIYAGSAPLPARARARRSPAAAGNHPSLRKTKRP